MTRMLGKGEFLTGYQEKKKKRNERRRPMIFHMKHSFEIRVQEFLMLGEKYGHHQEKLNFRI
jgi:hypothetical protein